MAPVPVAGVVPGDRQPGVEQRPAAVEPVGGAVDVAQHPVVAVPVVAGARHEDHVLAQHVPGEHVGRLLVPALAALGGVDADDADPVGQLALPHVDGVPVDHGGHRPRRRRALGRRLGRCRLCRGGLLGGGLLGRDRRRLLRRERGRGRVLRGLLRGLGRRCLGRRASAASASAASAAASLAAARSATSSAPGPAVARVATGVGAATGAPAPPPADAAATVPSTTTVTAPASTTRRFRPVPVLAAGSATGRPVTSSTQNGHPAGVRGQSGGRVQPAGGTHPGGGVGHPGAGLNLAVIEPPAPPPPWSPRR